jgi:transcriptional regulator with XRE-family HTH domain
VPAFRGSLLRQQRLARGLSRDGLALLSEKTVSAIARLERDEFNPSVLTVGRLADVLDCSVADFFDTTHPRRGVCRES